MTKRPVVHQFTAVLAGRDAVGHHLMAVDELLRELGCDTEIFAAHVNPEMRRHGRLFHDHADAEPADILLYQMSTGSPVANYLLERPEPLVLNYHNITPAPMFDPWEPHIGAELDRARRELRALARRARSAIAVSSYNADELRALGMGDVVVAPVLWELGVDGSVGGGEVLGDPTLLFVGRVAPNKCHEDLISAFAVVRRLWSGARLVLVGAVSSVGYERALVGLAQRLGVADGVVFAGSVSGDELVRWYERADVFLCLSEHEGFGVPLVEAMGFGVPVVAFGAAAVPETVGDGGLVLGVKDPVSVGLAVDRVLSDGELREVLVDAGRRRAGVFDVANTREANKTALARMIDNLVS